VAVAQVFGMIEARSRALALLTIEVFLYSADSSAFQRTLFHRPLSNDLPRFAGLHSRQEACGFS